MATIHPPVAADAGADPDTDRIAELTAELRRTRESLRESEERFSALQEASGDGIMVLDSIRDDAGTIVDFRWAHVNREAERIVGRSRRWLIGRRLLHEMPGNRAEGLFERYCQVVETGELWRGEFEYPHDGLDHTFRTVATRCGDGFVVVFQDVTVRQRVERELRRERERMYALFSHAPAFMGVVSGPEHVVEMANEAYYELLGTRDLVGRRVADALPDAAAQGFVALLDQVRATRQPFIGRSTPYLVRGPDGTMEERLLDFVYQPIVDAHGECSGIVSHGIDVTERVRSAEALRMSEQRFRSMMEHAADIVGVVNASGELIYTSPSFDRGLGYPDFALVGTGALELVHPDDLPRAQQALAGLVSGQAAVQQLELRVRNAAGSYRVLDMVSRSLLDDPAVRGILITGRDVTDQRALEEQLRMAQKMEAVGKLAGGVAHDFNNLLTVIDAHSAFLMETMTPGEQSHEDAAEIRKATQRAARLTRQLLAFSRKQLLAPRVVDLDATITEMAGMLGRLIGEDIEMRLDLERAPGSVLVDPGQMEQVLVNLVVNARDAMPSGGSITVTTRACEVRDGGEHPELAPGWYVMLTVTDTGHGIPDELQPRVFDPFFTTKLPGHGTGLGLSTVYGIVRQSGGAIWCRSRPGQGAAFTVALPRVDGPAVVTAEVARASRRGAETILLVEDEAAVRALASRVLAAQGYQVLEACDGEDALQVASAHEGDIGLVITDSIMPRMGGAQMAARLRAQRPGTAVLIMSGYTDDEMVRRGIEGDTATFLHKPFTAEELARRVREMLDECLTVSPAGA